LKRFLGALFLLWTGVILVTYYVVQKPGLLNSIAGLADTVWALVVAALLLFNAYGLGKRILYLLKFDSQDAVDQLLLRWGIGLGALGLLGVFYSVLQLAHRSILISSQIVLALIFLLRNDVKDLRSALASLQSSLNRSFSQYSFATKLTIILLLAFSFLLTLTPPFEAFDVLLYHLTQPAAILRDGGLRALDIFPFWYPTLTENTYLWALAFGSERVPQMLHLAWGILTVLLIWCWSTRIWGTEIGRKALLLVVTIPSLMMVAS
jgi:hypothetical protein